MASSAKQRMPKFRSDREAAAYFDTHDTAGLAEDLPAVPGPIIDARQPLKPISLRLPTETIAAARIGDGIAPEIPKLIAMLENARSQA